MAGPARPGKPAEPLSADPRRMQLKLMKATELLAKGIERHRAGSSQADEFLEGAYALLKEVTHAD